MFYPRIHIISCDESQHILPVTIYLLNKYFHTKLEIVILGYSKLDYHFPINVTYIELLNGKKRDKSKWFHDIYNYFNTINDEYIIFSVDDNPILNYVNLNELESIIYFMKKNNSSICYGNIEGKKNELLNESLNIYNVIPKYGHKTNLQFNIWKRQDLMKVLYNTNNPVEFELNGSKFIETNNKHQYIGISRNNYKRINNGIFANHNYSLLSESRNKDNIFILGINNIDINYIINNNLIDNNKMVYSPSNTIRIPYSTFKNNFSFDLLKQYILSKNLNIYNIDTYGYNIDEFENYFDISKRNINNEITIRTNNLLTNKNTMEHLFQIKDYPLSLSSIDKDYTNIKTMDMVFEICKETGIIQVRNAPSLNDIYINAHNSSYGKVWNNLFEEFKILINNYNFKTILEIGGGNLMLADKILKNNNKINNYTVYEVNSTIKHTTDTRINFIQEYFTKDTILDKSYDFIIHSHVLEHVWDPVEFINVISNVLDNNNYHGFIVPNLKSTLTKKYANSLNFEHNFFIIEDYIDVILYNCGLKILEKKYYLDHSILYITQKESISNIISKPYPNLYTENKILAMDWINYNTNTVNNFNSQLQYFDGEVYLFGATNFAILLIKLGLNIDKVVGILDNCKQKQGQKVYGCDFIIQNPVIIQDKEKVAVVLKAASYQEEIKKQLIQLNPNVLIIEE